MAPPSPPHDSKVLLLAKQNPQIGEFIWQQLSPTQQALWMELGQNGATIAELELLRPDLAVVTEVYALQALGAVVLEPAQEQAVPPQIALGTQDIPPITIHGLVNPTQRERQLLQLSVGLSDKEKARILQVARAVQAGKLHDLLGLGAESDRKQLKRAYFNLSKELHPDRYFKRELGAFAPILDQSFRALAQYVKALGDKRTTLPASFRGNTRSRRRSKRFGLNLRVRAKCDSWGGPEWAVSQDISSGGVFLVTENSAYVGEPVQLLLDAPSGPCEFAGTVVSLCDADQARRRNSKPGIGVAFSQAAQLTKESLSKLLIDARRAPTSSAATTAPHASRRVARGSGIVHKQDPIIGIDLGTTNTAVSAVIDNKVRILPWPNGSYSMPSIVGFPHRGHCVVGHQAQALLLASPHLALSSGKRLVGRQIDDASIVSYMAEARYPNEPGPDGTVISEFWGESYAMPQICSYLFSAARHSASQRLKTDVKRAVLTIPVSFDDKQIQAMRRAAQLAQLDVVEIIEEPCAAALANQGQKHFEGIIGVYDFGGGTFDFSLVEVGSGDMQILATTGDSWLGGDDFDLALASAVADMFSQTSGIDLRHRAVEWQHLVHSCEVAKRELSQQERSQVVVPDVLRTASGASDLRVGLARNRVELLWADVIRRSIDTCTHALSLAQIPKSKLAGIYLSGGTSYIPAIRRCLAQRFQVPVHQGISPEHAVCAGAGVRAADIQSRGKHPNSRSYSL